MKFDDKQCNIDEILELGTSLIEGNGSINLLSKLDRVDSN